MKNLFFAVLSLMIVSCGGKHQILSENGNKDSLFVIMSNEKDGFAIDTVRVKDSISDGIQIMVVDADYPKFRNKSDDAFLDSLNRIFRNNFVSDLNYYKKEIEIMIQEIMINLSEQPEEKITLYASHYVRSDFQVFCTKELVSIFQYFGIGGSYFSERAHHHFVVTNVDLKNKKVLTQQDLGITPDKIELINKKISLYFIEEENELWDKECYGYYNYINNESELSHSQFFVENDTVKLSLFMCGPGDCWLGAMCGERIIPIHKYQPEVSTQPKTINEDVLLY